MMSKTPKNDRGWKMSTGPCVREDGYDICVWRLDVGFGEELTVVSGVDTSVGTPAWRISVSVDQTMVNQGRVKIRPPSEDELKLALGDFDMADSREAEVAPGREALHAIVPAVGRYKFIDGVAHE